MSIAGYRALAALSAIALIVSSTCAGAFIASDILEFVPSHAFLKCSTSLQVDSDSKVVCPPIWAQLVQSLLDLPDTLRPLVEAALIRAEGKDLISISHSKSLELENAMATQFWLRGVTMTLVLEIGAAPVSHIALVVQEPTTNAQFRCGLSVKRSALSREMLCVDSTSTSEPISLSVAFSVSTLATYADFEVIQVVVGRESNGAQLVVSALPTALDSHSAYIIEYSGKEVSSSEVMVATDHRRAQVSTLENISSEEKPVAGPDGFYSGGRVAGMVVGGASVLIIFVILVVTMVISGGKKSVSPGKSVVSAGSGTGNGSGVSGSAIEGVGVSGVNSKQGNGSRKPESASPASYNAVASTTTLSTTASSTPGSGGGVVGGNGGVSALGSVPLAGGVISASMSSAMKGAYSMSPGSDTPLQSELIGTHVSQFFEAGSFRPGGGSPGAAGKGGISGSPTGNVTSQQRKSAKKGSPHPAASASPDPYPAGYGTKGKGKTERVALNTDSLYSPRVKPPPKISNAALAALPTEPSPKVKQRYLAAHAAPLKPLSAAARNLRFRDVVPNAQAHGGGGSLGNDHHGSSASVQKGTLRRKKKHIANSSSGGGTDDFDSYLDEESSFFSDDDEDWIDDIVEPHPDDPVYKNDDTYIEIDVEKLEFVAPPAPDASVDALDSHITALTSPLSSTSSLSRSNSSVSSSQQQTHQTQAGSSTLEARRASAAPGSRTALKLSKSTESLSGLSSSASSSSVSSSAQKESKRKSAKAETSMSPSSSSAALHAAPKPIQSSQQGYTLAVSADSIVSSSSGSSLTPNQESRSPLSASTPVRAPATNALSSSSASPSPAASPSPSSSSSASKWSFAKPASGRP